MKKIFKVSSISPKVVKLLQRVSFVVYVTLQRRVRVLMIVNAPVLVHLLLVVNLVVRPPPLAVDLIVQPSSRPQRHLSLSRRKHPSQRRRLPLPQRQQQQQQPSLRRRRILPNPRRRPVRRRL